MRSTLRVRLTASFVAVTVLAVLVVALEVLPTLESSLAQERLRGLVSETTQVVRRAEPHGRPPTSAAVDGLVEAVAARTGGRVGVVGAAPGATASGPASTVGAATPAGRALARRALDTAHVAVDLEPGGPQVARTAVPLAARPGVPARALVVEKSLDDVHETVGMVERRLVIGGAIAVLIALLAGGLTAAGVARRVRRLTRGSHEVAAGHFTTRFDTGARDELGALARSLDTMQRQLGELDSSRRRFIATASHELRTPLSSLSGFVELLQSEDLDEETRRAFLEELAAQVRRLARLSGDLLDLSRLESGGLQLRAESCDLHDLAVHVAAEFTAEVERTGRSLKVRLVGAQVLQRCDPARVEQIIRILVDNAMKHSGPRAAVEVRVARSGVHSRIAVTDRGPGVDPEDLPHLFEPFHGAGDGSGAGLGLAIARELAHRMRGELEVEAKPGRTTFTLELPV